MSNGKKCRATPRGTADTCLTLVLLRDIMKIIYDVKDVNGVESKDSFKPFTKKGGKNGKNDHRHKSGIYKTIQEEFQLPEEQWLHPDIHVENEALQEMRRRGTLERIRQRFKPYLMGDFCNGLLATDHITEVVEIATNRKRSFAMLGTFNSSRNSVKHINERVKKFSQQEYKRRGRRYPKIKSYGLVLNTDDSNEGVHWVSALFFPYKKRWEYFDSFGDSPSKRVERVLNSVRKEMSQTYGFDNGEWTTPDTEPIQHQEGAIQCGMYAAWFIIQRIENKISYDEIQSEPIRDNEMEKLRSKYFLKPSKEVREAYERTVSEIQRLDDVRISTMELKEDEDGTVYL